jgi:transcriptional antiterminator NusG
MAKRWYSVSVLSNFEKKIAEQIKTAVEDAGLQDEIDEVLVPTEEVIEVRRGKKVTSERRFMPGYVLVHMEMTSNRGYHLISSINRVTGFLGPQGKPMPMRDAEVNAILNRVEEGLEAPRNLIRFDIGEKVKVTDGPFEGFDGMVEEVDEGAQPPEGLGLDLRARDARGTGIHPGVEGHLSAARGRRAPGNG